MIPTLWIVLGPLGQSVTAANLLGSHAGMVVQGANASCCGCWASSTGCRWAGSRCCGSPSPPRSPSRTARRHLPFSLTWWSFTFPVGTCVTGAAELAADTGRVELRVLAMVLFAGLAVAWLTVASRTARESRAGGCSARPDLPGLTRGDQRRRPPAQEVCRNARR